MIKNIITKTFQEFLTDERRGIITTAKLQITIQEIKESRDATFITIIDEFINEVNVVVVRKVRTYAITDTEYNDAITLLGASTSKSDRWDKLYQATLLDYNATGCPYKKELLNAFETIVI